MEHKFIDTGGDVNAHSRAVKRSHTSLTDDVVTYIEFCEAKKLSTYATDIKTALKKIEYVYQKMYQRCHARIIHPYCNGLNY